jgi:hypothetical protein
LQAASGQPATLTNFSDERPTWLAPSHRALDEAVFDAYGWDPVLSDEILAALLELNLERSAPGWAGPQSAGADNEEEE